MATETLEIENIPAERLTNAIKLRERDGWKVRAVNVEPDGEYTVIFEREKN